MTEGTDTNLCYLPATRLVELYEWKTLSPVEVTKAVLARIEEVDGAVNAFVMVDAEAALAQAAESERRWMDGNPKGLADGVPVTVKDLLPTKGHTTRRGSKLTPEDAPERFDAPAVARLREHGAVIVGRTTTPEFGWKGITDSPLTGVTRNPWDVSKTTGGSSGGAAAAAALGMGALNIGTDAGGSVRIPAGFTGVFAHKPTFGRVPVHPPSPMGTLSHVGPITRTVEDAAMMLNVMVQPDPRDWHALPYDPWDFRTGLDLGVNHLQVAYSPNLGYADVDPEVAEIVAAAVQVLADQGAEIEEVDPGFGDPVEIFETHWYWGAKRLLDTLPEDRWDELDPGLAEIAAAGREFTLDRYTDAVDARIALGRKMNLFHETYDLLVTPALPIPAFEAGVEVADATTQKRWMAWTPFTYPFNLTGQPACVVPCGFTKAGLPVGLQIVGPNFADPLVMRAAGAFEQARPFEMPDAPKGG
ncbi:MAG: amidase [Magnetovibrio sp.]|nr:amidase [Magnetovibrio sp.]